MSAAATPHGAIGAPATRGVVLIHSASTALCPHIGWAIESVLGKAVTIEWTSQPLSPRAMRTEVTWRGPQGTGAELASALRGWDSLRYEVTEEPSAGADGSRWSYTPDLGIHHTWISASGDAVVNEDRLRHAVAQSLADPSAFAQIMDTVLGTSWDAELEPYRMAGQKDAPVRLLRVVNG